MAVIGNSAEFFIHQRLTKILYSGLTTFRNLFFARQFSANKFLEASPFDRKNITDFGATRIFESADKQKMKIFILREQENHFHFLGERNFKEEVSSHV